MNINFKLYVENNFDYLVKLYNRYIRYQLKNTSTLEYYASPYMNLMGFPSNEFMLFCQEYYNKKFNLKYKLYKKKYNKSKNMYMYIRLLFLFIVSNIFFIKNLKNNAIIIDGIHSDEYFNNKPYQTSKTPPLEYFEDKNIYHSISISFVSIRSLFKYKENNIIFSLSYLTIIEFLKIHYLAFKIFIQSKKINLFPISYYQIVYILTKGISTANLINTLDNKSKYFNIWEKRGHQFITDFLLNNKEQSIILDLGIFFKLGPENMMLNYIRHDIKSTFLFMSKFNYESQKNYLGDVRYYYFKNYRMKCVSRINLHNIENKILLISPLDLEKSLKLYSLILKNKNDKLEIKIKLHPYLDKSNFSKEHVEEKDIYESMNNYGGIIYQGMTSASVELYFAGCNIYRMKSNNILDIDVLIDNNLVNIIESLDEIEPKNKSLNELDKEYYLGCNNKTLKEVLIDIDE